MRPKDKIRFFLALILCFLLCDCSSSPAFLNTNPPYYDEGLQRLENILLAEINRCRDDFSCPPLKMVKNLSGLARRYSRDMGERNFFAHIDPNNRNVGDRLLAAGIEFSLAAENLAMVTKGDLVPRALVRAWLQSKEHRRNLLDEKFVDTGIGVFRDSQGRYYITHIFLLPKTQ